MRPEQPLVIYEIRALDEAAFGLFEKPGVLESLGPLLAGLHWEADFAFIFFTAEADSEIAELLRKNTNLCLSHTHFLTYAQWQDGAGAEPFTVAGLTVCGPDDPKASTDGDGMKIIVDPGLAFGFGGHPTTYSCLDFLGRACRNASSQTASVLDLGAGTGILSLAAARWGIPTVVGVDYSHLAVEAARRNLALNRLDEQVAFFRGPAQAWASHKAELLLANLHLSLQEELLALGAFNNRRLAIISGLFPSEGDGLFEKLKAIGFRLVDQVRTDRWITMFLENETWLEPAA